MLLGHNLDIIFMILPGADGWCGSYGGGRRMEEPPDDALVLTHALESLVRSHAHTYFFKTFFFTFFENILIAFYIHINADFTDSHFLYCKNMFFNSHAGFHSFTPIALALC